MSSKNNTLKHPAFFPVITLVLLLWVIYRSVFTFPVWFDETIGKAVFFGLPVWLYVTISGSRSIPDTFAGYKLHSGVLLGLAVGGLFGFVASGIALLQRGGVVESAWLFSSSNFWYEFVLALFTGFWETLLFFSFVLLVIKEKFASWGSALHALLASGIFLLFHLPNTLLRYDLDLVLAQLGLLFLFALGQSYLFIARKNAWALVLSHALWGMVLLVHFW